MKFSAVAPSEARVGKPARNPGVGGFHLVFDPVYMVFASLPGVYMVEGEVLQLDLVYMAKNNRRHVDPLIAL